MAGVELVSTTLVEAPASQEAIKNKIELSPSGLKLLLLGSIQKGLLFLKPNSSIPTLIQNLKTSFAQTLQFFYPLAGRLSSIQHQDHTISVFIDCNNAGAQFVYAIAENVTVSDILEPVFIPSVVHSFFPLTQNNNYDGVSNPLLGVQITELSDGIFIGCSMNHTVADGCTFWNFMNSWSEISRGNRISKLPAFDDLFKNHKNFPIRLPVSIIDSDLKFDFNFNSSSLKEKVFHFSKEKIATLKAKANSEAGMENNVVISSLLAVLAHIWRAVIRNEGSKSEQETKFMLQIGFRRRFQPEIPDGYFGTAFQSEVMQLKAREVIENELGVVALQMNKLVSNCTEEKIRNSIDSWIEDPKLLCEISKDVVVTSGSHLFDVYGNDFGWEKPKAVRSGPANKCYCKLTVYQGLERGSMDIEVCHSAMVLEAMGNDSAFMDVVTI
ncbi:HXXXD-type acyl-transferase family protein [Euphorbia peplus]|nr:HXXXD-type acyl-transferase family protein [Euphorbia peplus]